MDVAELLASAVIKVGDIVDLSGWLVDTNDGLYILGDHYPEDYNHPCRVLVGNGNIIYPILTCVPSLGGGWSALFYRAKVKAIVVCESPWIVRVEHIAIESDRGSGDYSAVDIRPEIVAAYVDKNGEYQFRRARGPMRDWLDD